MELPKRRLIVNADDFGRSTSINEAVTRAHQDGILTSASLMVNEPAFDQAAQIARKNPNMGVGLHLVLVCGQSACGQHVIPDLVNHQSEFSNNAITSGIRFFFQRSLRAQLQSEIAAQFERFRSTGLVLDHVNGHLNMHLHPVVFDILMENATRWGITHLRLTSDPLSLNRKLARGKMVYRASHAWIYRMLCRRARPCLQKKGIRHTQYVFGLLQNGEVNETFLTQLLSNLPPGDSELYSHPSLHEFKHELDALISPRVKELLRKFGIQLIRYQDL